MISIRNLSLNFGRQQIFENAELTIFSRQKVGLVGVNGSGKSTLFGLLLGENEPDVGNVDIDPGLTIAHALQHTPSLSCSALDYVLQGDKAFYHLYEQIQAAESQGQHELLVDLYLQYEDVNGYTATARAGELLHGLGFSASDFDQPIKSFSGGWRVRLNLAQALMCPSTLLLLDEPTNHLDMDAILWLEDWLKGYPGTLVIISHDRDFLDRVITHTVHIEHKKIKSYTGNYSDFEKRRADDLVRQQALYEKQQKQVAHMKGFIDRFRAKASKAKQAQSRMKALERMELISAAQSELSFRFEFLETKLCANPLIVLDDVAVAYDEFEVFSKVKLSLENDARIGLLGRNGAGKSTLIKLLVGELKPKVGYCHLNKGIKVGYFAQHQVEQLVLTDSPLMHLQRIDPNSSEQALRNFLGQYQFANEKALKPIAKFSGGEKARLALAMIIWQAPNLLLLDEPTNHLDLDMREALAMALQSYQGALVVVSHDRHLLKMTVDQFWLIANHTVTVFSGDLDDYRKEVFEHNAQVKRERKQDKKNQKNKNSEIVVEQCPKKSRELKQALTKLENKMEKLQNGINDIEIALAEQSIYEAENKQKLDKILTEQKTLKEHLEILEAEWFEINEQLEP